MAKFGYKTYFDAKDNAPRYTLDELRQLPVGAKVLLLNMQYEYNSPSLRFLSEETVTSNDADEIILSEGYPFSYEEMENCYDSLSEDESCAIIKPR